MNPENTVVKRKESTEKKACDIVQVPVQLRSDGLESIVQSKESSTDLLMEVDTNEKWSEKDKEALVEDIVHASFEECTQNGIEKIEKKHLYQIS